MQAPIAVWPDPLDRLAELLEANALRRLDPSFGHRDWLVKGILEALRNNRPLEEALGLKGPGKCTIRDRLLMLSRDQKIVAAVGAVAFESGVTAWQRCKRLEPIAAAIVAQWPTLRRTRRQPAADWPEAKRLLFEAMAIGVGLPATARGLYGVVQRARQFSLHDRPATLLASYL